MTVFMASITQKSDFIDEHYLKSNANKFIFFSSVKAVADKVGGEYLTEEALPNPQTPYGKSKLEAEKYTKGRLNEWVTSQPDCHPEHSEGSLPIKCHPERSEGSLAIKRLQIKNHTIATDSSSSLLRMTLQKKVYILRPSMIHGPGNKGNGQCVYF
jgi:dTDP-4-dehydrorhamnose reductase